MKGLLAYVVEHTVEARRNPVQLWERPRDDVR
jgi:hypothetical protein